MVLPNDILYLIPIGKRGDDMDVSTKGRYGIKAVLDLAIHAKDKHVALKQVAERQNISERYLEQIFSLLRKSGFIKSVKGPLGGYSLNCDINEVTMLDLLAVLEGDLLIERPQEEGDIFGKSINTSLWKQVDNSIKSTLGNITIKDLVKSYELEMSNNYNMYYI